MLLHVRAKPRRAAFELDLANKTALHERIETIINRRMGNLRHRLLRADENFLGGRMIALLHDHVINVLALRREAKTAGGQSRAEIIICFSLDCIHGKAKIAVSHEPVKI